MIKSQMQKSKSGKTAVRGRMKKGRILLQVLLPIAILALGIAVMILLIKLRKPPQRTESKPLAPLVKVSQLYVQDVPMVIVGDGTVTPKVQVEVVPQVSGKIVSINSQYKAGGFIPAGKELFKIDPRDYQLAVRQADAGVAEAQVKVDLEKSEAQIAREEWEQLHSKTEPSSPLVFREPQIRLAKAALESAKAALAMTKLNLERTSVFLPIDVRILSESADLGQYVVAGRMLGSAYGVEAVEIELPLADEDLAWFDIPDDNVSGNNKNTPEKTTVAIVEAVFAGAKHTWQGHVVRTTGQIDRKTRFISVVIEVPKPFDISGGKPALLPGMFVEVFIQGNMLKNVIAVPREAFHNENKVWVVRDGRLYIQDVETVRKTREFSYVTTGIKDGAMLVTSALDIVVDGMAVRFESQAVDEYTADSNSAVPEDAE